MDLIKVVPVLAKEVDLLRKLYKQQSLLYVYLA